MSYVATAVGGSVVGGALNYMGSQNAASAETSAANTAAGAQLSMFGQEQATEQPYVQAGTNALSQINQNMGYFNQPFTMQQFQQSPGYQFSLQQGQQAIQNSSAAQGGLVSGAQQAALNNYSQNMANNEYQNAFNNYQTQTTNSYNRLAGIAQLGQGAAANTGSAAIQTGANLSNVAVGAGNAQAAGYVGGANAIGGAISNGTNGLLLSNMMANQ